MIDGFKITSLLASFFLIHAPELVKAGMIYKLVPPLYKMEGKKFNGSEYLDSKKHFIEMLQKDISKNYEIKAGKHKLAEKDIKKFMEMNSKYLRYLNRLSNKLSVHPDILEVVLNNRNLSKKDMVKLINKNYKFMDATLTKDKITVEGVFGKEFQFAVIDDKLYEKSYELIRLIEDNENYLGTDYKLDGEKITISHLLNKFKKFEPKKTRFKGLGEMEADDFWETCLHPDKRQMVRLTSDDIEKDIHSFRLLHSTKVADREERNSMFAAFKIDLDDIDN